MNLFPSVGTFKEIEPNQIRVNGSWTQDSLVLDLDQSMAELKVGQRDAVSLSLVKIELIRARVGSDERWSSDEPIAVLDYTYDLLGNEGSVLSWCCREDYSSRYGSAQNGPIPGLELARFLAGRTGWKLDTGNLPLHRHQV